MYSCYLLDLTLINSIEDVEKLIKQLNSPVPKEIFFERVVSFRNGNRFTKNIPAKKLWADAITHKVFAYETSKDRFFFPGFLSYLNEMTPTIPGDTIHIIEGPNLQTTNPQIVLDLDSILDKISKWGMGSLNNQEKDFLKNQN